VEDGTCYIVSSDGRAIEARITAGEIVIPETAPGIYHIIAEGGTKTTKIMIR
jgi:hypothetical protein